MITGEDIKDIPGIGLIDYIGSKWNLRVRAERYDDDGYAELGFFLKNETDEKLLHLTRVNLLATPSMNSLAKRLEKNSTEIPWLDILTYITGKTVQYARQGEPVEAVGKKPETMKVEYQLSPILEKNQPTTIYGPGGYAKSYLAAYIACLVQFDHKGIGDCWIPILGNVLYLDWESSLRDHERRGWAIKQGLGISTEETFAYRFCHQPLAADIYNIQRIITEKKISLLIIDSQMAAEGYGPHPAQVSSQYYNALRSLHCTSLTLDHVSKAEWGKVADSDSLGPYGSVVKFNRSRSQFEISEPVRGDNFLEFALRHRKHNEGNLLGEIGIRIDFHNNNDGHLEKVAFGTFNVSEHPEVSKVQGLKQRLIHSLSAGSRRPKDLADELEKTEATIRATLYRYKDTFVKVGEEWELKAYES
jgi:hypothetical protein